VIIIKTRYSKRNLKKFIIIEAHQGIIALTKKLLKVSKVIRLNKSTIPDNAKTITGKIAHNKNEVHSMLIGCSLKVFHNSSKYPILFLK
jgi:hypothetical protein